MRYLLAERFYKTVGKPGTYTCKKGLDRETNKALLLKHLTRNEEGSPLSDLQAVLPGLSNKQIQHLLAEMKEQATVRCALVRGSPGSGFGQGRGGRVALALAVRAIPRCADCALPEVARSLSH